MLSLAVDQTDSLSIGFSICVIMAVCGAALMDRAGIAICLAGIAVGLVTLALGEHIPAGSHHLWVNVAFSLFGLGILAGLVPLVIPSLRRPLFRAYRLVKNPPWAIKRGFMETSQLRCLFRGRARPASIQMYHSAGIDGERTGGSDSQPRDKVDQRKPLTTPQTAHSERAETSDIQALAGGPTNRRTTASGSPLSTS